ncbi:MAG TPA: hypothetical protein PKZ76_14925 [Xanthomonadaceae bacterium]|nr:hypothetical protein [Xanthomonadaceae bacterium]
MAGLIDAELEWRHKRHRANHARMRAHMDYVTGYPCDGTARCAPMLACSPGR